MASKTTQSDLSKYSKLIRNWKACSFYKIMVYSMISFKFHWQLRKKYIAINYAASTVENRTQLDKLNKRQQKLVVERQKENSQERHLALSKIFQELKLPKYLLHAVFYIEFDRPSSVKEEAFSRMLQNL